MPYHAMQYKQARSVGLARCASCLQRHSLLTEQRFRLAHLAQADKVQQFRLVKYSQRALKKPLIFRPGE